jgi:thiol-disulfide isomerase/thioredoxin
MRQRSCSPSHSVLWTLVFFALAAAAIVNYVPRKDTVAGEKAAKKDNEPKERVPAPELDGAVDWINSAGPIKLADLRGRIVLLDFWTLCCINCIHTLPDLAKLEAKYPGILVVLGIHSPKFPNEEKTESIRKAVLRYQIKHPVANDADMKIWRRYRANSWPTLVLIDPEGNLVARGSGEGLYDAVEEFVEKLAKEYRAKKMLKEDPINFQLAKEKEQTPLYFPGKVLADAKSNRLFIADSTHHRIVITDLDGNKVAIAGSGVEGLMDGAFYKAQFSDPQGMCLDGDLLYVADRKNHCLRALNLKDQTVKTVAGIGEQDRGGRDGGGPALKTGLNSPWDLLLHDKKIYIAMAGHHQIWTYDPAKEIVRPFAGNGRENIKDGHLYESEFAQPSGLASDGKHLYVADSEVSAIRAVPYDIRLMVETIVGQGLFEFGDVDGEGTKVRLQHALGVAYRDGKLYVADTYNSKLKVIDPVRKTCVTFLGQDPKANLFSEPGGLSFAGDKLYVADTNNHRIQVVDMKTKAVTTLALQGVTPPAPAPKAEKKE